MTQEEFLQRIPDYLAKYERAKLKAEQRPPNPAIEKCLKRISYECK